MEGEFRRTIGSGIAGSALCAALLLAACGGAATSTPVPSPTPTRAPTATATQRALPGAAASPALPRPSASAAAPGTTATTSAGAVAAGSDGSCPDSHPIKAARLGPARTYHLKGDTGYDAARAEECFATEATAQAAGYRRIGR